MLFTHCAILFVCSTLCSASAETIPQYTSRSWQTDEGLPGNSVRAIVQSSDGCLWVGTKEGLARFNAVDFASFTPGNTANIKHYSITALHETRDGSLWIGTAAEGVTRLRDGTFAYFAQAQGFSNESVETLYEDREGNLWIAGSNVLLCLKKGNPESVSNWNADTEGATTILQDDAGQIWVGSARGLKILRGEELETPETVASLANTVITALIQDQSGSLWIGTREHGLFRLADGKVTNYTQREGLLDNTIRAIFQDRHGTIWIGSNGGLNSFSNGELVSAESALYRDSVYFIYEDREANLWLATNDGLRRLRRKQFTTFNAEHGLAHNRAMSICEGRDGQIWIGTWGGGLSKFAGGQFTTFSVEDGLCSALVSSVHEDKNGTLWIGTGGGGLNRFEDGRWTHYRVSRDPPEDVIRVLYSDRNDVLWIGTSDGLFSLKGGALTRFTMEDGLPDFTIRSISEDLDGTLWIGTWRGLAQFRNGRFSLFATEGPLATNVILSLFCDSENVVWIGTDSAGLHRLQNGNVTSYTKSDGLFSDTIYSIVQDDQDCLWMSCSRGLFRINKKDLAGFQAGKLKSVTSISYGQESGMISGQCNGASQPAACKTKDGRLWFATLKGVVVSLPERTQRNEVVPPIKMTAVLADKKKLPAGRDLRAPPGRGELEIHYTALSFCAPEKNRFKYKLDGVDADWVEADTRRVAYYNNLAPGQYRFRVIGSNNDGVWNEAGAAFSIFLEPHFWQTRWFLFLAASTAIAFVGGTVRYATHRKLRRQLELLERQRAIERERSRIAEDMHDTLGARLTEILVLSGLAKTSRHRPQEIEAHVEKISNRAQEVIDSLHGIVWAINPKNDSLDKLASYIYEQAQAFLELSSIRCRFDVPDTLPDIPVSAEVRHNLFLVVKEALNNIVKHAAATEVCLRLSVNNSILSIGIEDDGKGIAAHDASALGNGLFNMRKRIESIGGCFEISAGPGKGTRITLHIPLRSDGVIK